MAQKQILPPNIRVDRNCQPIWVTQNEIPEEQDLFLLGGGGRDSPPPTDTGLTNQNDLKKMMKFHNFGRTPHPMKSVKPINTNISDD